MHDEELKFSAHYIFFIHNRNKLSKHITEPRCPFSTHFKESFFLHVPFCHPGDFPGDGNVFLSFTMDLDLPHIRLCFLCTAETQIPFVFFFFVSVFIMFIHPSD